MTAVAVESHVIDKSLVDGLGTDTNDSALVAAILAMAEALSLSVTAEGVETADQLAILGQLSCDHAQGFHLARPMPTDQMDLLVTGGPRWQLR